MSVIGSYIHVTAAGYNTFGTDWYNSAVDEKGGYSPPDIAAYVNQKAYLKQRFKSSKVEGKAIAELQNALNALFSPEGVNTNSEYDAGKAEAWDFIKSEMAATFEKFNALKDNLDNFLDPTTMDINYAAVEQAAKDSYNMSEIQTKKSQAGLGKKFYLSGKVKSNFIKNYESIREKYEEVTSMIARGEAIDASMAEAVTSKWKEIQAQIEKLDVQQGGEGVSYVKTTDDTAKAEVKKLVKMAGTWSLFPGAGELKQWKGALMELVVTAAARMASNTLRKEMSNLVGSLPEGGVRVGQNGTFLTYNKIIGDKIRDKEVSDSLGIDTSRKVGDMYLSTHSSQTKADVIMNVTDTIMVPISIKNLQGGINRPISLVSGTSLYTLIQDLDVDIVNNALNIFAKHNSFVTVNPQNSSDNVIDAGLIATWHNSFKILAVINALYGGESRLNEEGVARYFLVNDSTQPCGYKIYDMMTIIDKLLERYIVNIKDADSKGLTVSAEFTELENTYVGDEPSPISAVKRINNLIKNLHSRKVSIKLNPSFMSEVSSI